jgi:hypothetical protein
MLSPGDCIQAEPRIPQTGTDRQHTPARNIFHERDLTQTLHNCIIV